MPIVNALDVAWHDAAPDAVSAIRPTWHELAVVFIAALLGGYGVLQGIAVEYWVNETVPVFLAAGLLIGAVHMLRQTAAAIWSPMLWLRIVLIAYSGVGSLVPLFVNDATRMQIDSYYTLYPESIAKYNLVSVVFAISALIIARVVVSAMASTLSRLEHWSMRQTSAFTPFQFGVLALLISLPFKTIEWIPFVGGPQINIPASIGILSTLSYMAYPLMIYGILQRRRGVAWAVFIPVALDSAYGLLLFTKAGALLPVIFACLGFLMHRATLRRAIIIAASIAITYIAITPLTNYGRIQSYGQDLSAQDNLKIVSEYRPGAEPTNSAEEYQASWARFSYVNAGSYAIGQYDNGLPGDTIGLISSVLVPRVLYPDKPSATRAFVDFNLAVTGSDTSQSSPGIPAEGYWNYGWPGVIVVALTMGAVFAFWSVYAILVVQAQAWHLLFVVMLGVRSAARIDGLVATDFVPMVVLALVAHVVLTTGNELFRRRRTDRIAVALPKRYAGPHG